MKKNILITSVHMDIGGIETVLVELLNKIDSQKYDVDLYLFKKQGVNLEHIPSYINVKSIYDGHKWFKWFKKIDKRDHIIAKIIRRIIFNRYTIKYWLPKKQYDVGIAFAGYHDFMDYYVAESNSTLKYIWVHTDYYYLYQRGKYQKQKKYNKFNKIVGVSKDVQDQFIKIYPEYREKVIYIWNLYSKKKTIKSSRKLKGNYKIIAVGRMTEQKGFERLINVHEQLLKKNIDITTYLVGNGELQEQLKTMVNQKKMADSFIFLGKRTDVLSLMMDADLYVLTSYYEGLSTVVLESLSVGLPVVAPKITGVGDIANEIAPEHSIILVDNNTEAIVNGVEQAMKKLKKGTFSFEIDEYNRSTLKKYEELLDGKIL